MSEFRSNKNDILQVIFQGSILEGRTPQANLADIGAFVGALENLVQFANPRLQDEVRLGLVDAKAGSLEILLQIFAVSAGLVSTLADAPAALRNAVAWLHVLVSYEGRPPIRPSRGVDSGPPIDINRTIMQGLAPAQMAALPA